jgi:asparagine synthase (glutamine-hydrolysing)
MQLAAQHRMKVLLDGQGADEILGGYMHSFYRLVGGLLRRFRLWSAHREFYAHTGARRFGFGETAGAFGKSLLAGLFPEQRLYEMEYRHYFPFLSEGQEADFHLDEAGGSRLNRFLYHLTFHTSLPSLLHYEDRNAMAFSIESRVPFLDHRLVEFVFSLPDEDKIRMGETKWMLRQGLSGILPEAIRRRGDKKGFVTPGEVKWLRGPLRHLLDEKADGLGFLDTKKAEEVVRRFLRGSNNDATLVWRYAVLKRWMQQSW